MSYFSVFVSSTSKKHRLPPLLALTVETGSVVMIEAIISISNDIKAGMQEILTYPPQPANTIRLNIPTPSKLERDTKQRQCKLTQICSHGIRRYNEMLFIFSLRQTGIKRIH